jgi:hypothetical protein
MDVRRLLDNGRWSAEALGNARWIASPERDGRRLSHLVSKPQAIREEETKS